ncbi:MAG: asparagine synthase (glutamine-hydrolyzing) [Candidatus Kerfeldbacteria bacterium]|nr:asparagine synthase (glutamine-hydrolyzing) [Candidatus Kerfeldbacteria bacterium]
MCGIAGKVYFDPGYRLADQEIDQMLNQIKHRGPDDFGIECFGQAGLGQRRLAIIDVSPAGHNPMTNEDGTVWITFNGEIYNYLDFRDDLIKRGHRFTSKTDTEVIIHLYEEYGEDCVKKLRGMFAFAIWDVTQKKLLLARDRVGKKPLKYYIDDKHIAFASELKAILADPAIPRIIDEVAIHHYLTLQYVQHPATGFKGIQKLPPGHYLTMQHGRVEIKRYWNLDYSHKLNLSEADWCERIIAKLDEATRIRLMSDVPLGAFLSGGIDSSAVVAMMARHSDQPVKTFSIGFNEASHDETRYARMIAQQFATNHIEFTVEPKAVELFPTLAWHFEEPFADPSAIPTYYVAKLTRQHVTVALNGDGGDENFAGYGRYNYHLMGKKYAMIPSWLRQGLLVPGADLAKHLIKTTFFDRAARFAHSLADAPEHRYYNYICYFTTEEKESIYTKNFAERMRQHDSAQILSDLAMASGSNDYLDKILYTDINSYLPNALMAKVDIAAMANSLEGRSPLLDHELLELTAQIPSLLKIKNGETKYIFKKALEPMLPREILYRPKMGFGVPLVHWFRGELKDYMYDTILDGKLLQQGWFDRNRVKQLLDTHATTDRDYANHIWSLIMLEHWLRTWF